MTSYEGSSLTEIEAVLDGLDEATSLEVFDATRGYAPRAIASVAASRADAAGGGGGGAVAVTEATLTPVQIAALADTPAEIVAAAAGKIRLPVSWSVRLVYDTTPYTATDSFVYVSWADQVPASRYINDAFWASEADIITFGPLAPGLTADPFTASLAGVSVLDSVGLHLYSDGTAPVGGDSDVVVTVSYLTMDL